MLWKWLRIEYSIDIYCLDKCTVCKDIIYLSLSRSFCLQVSGRGRKLLFFLSPASPAKLTPHTRLDTTAQRDMGHCFKHLVCTGEENDGRNVRRCDGDHEEEEEDGAGDVDEEDDPGPGGQPHLYISVDIYSDVSRYIL